MVHTPQQHSAGEFAWPWTAAWSGTDVHRGTPVVPQVYHSNLKLGGPQVMGANGVSNYVVSDDAEGMAAFLRWLSFTPAHCGGPVPIVPTSDPGDSPNGKICHGEHV